MKLLIDADGCPVVDIALRLANARGIACLLVCDTAHKFHRDGAQTITVSKGADSADFALVNLVERGDIVVTQDYGLAAMCLACGALPLNQNGLLYTNENIDSLLHQRHTAKKIRRSGGRLKGPPKRVAEMDRAFEGALNGLLDRLKEEPLC